MDQPPLPTRLERASSQSRYGAPMMPVTTPTGSVGGQRLAGHDVGAEHEHRADQRRGQQCRAASPTRRRAIGAREQGHELDRAGGGGGQRGERDGAQHEEQPGALDAEAEPGRRLVAEHQQPQRPAQDERDRDQDQHRQRPAGWTSAQVRPLSEPVSQINGGLHVVDARLGQQVGRARVDRRGDADADEDQPVGRDARASRRGGRSSAAEVSAPTQRGERRARCRWRAGRRSPNTAASDAPEVMPMKSGEASGLRAIDWNIAPDRPKAAPTSTAGRAPAAAAARRR